MEDLREKALALEMYNQQIQILQQEIASIRGLKEEIEKCINTLENVKVDDETLIPVGPGVFLKAKIIDDKAIYGIKSDIFVEKPISDVIENLKKSLEDLNKAEEEGLKKLNEITALAMKLKEELQKEFEKQQKNQQKKN
ncbi:prefoldin subunit alpha [Methanocaldococcus indicus]|uniref:prefoldin subunit alpha n=1 Tax=Methanocaldococcus indicus TaxID=213231 RepID=UPI003C6CFE3D